MPGRDQVDVTGPGVDLGGRPPSEAHAATRSKGTLPANRRPRADDGWVAKRGLRRPFVGLVLSKEVAGADPRRLLRSERSVGHRPLGVADLEQADLAEIDMGEGV